MVIAARAKRGCAAARVLGRSGRSTGVGRPEGRAGVEPGVVTRGGRGGTAWWGGGGGWERGVDRGGGRGTPAGWGVGVPDGTRAPSPWDGKAPPLQAGPTGGWVARLEAGRKEPVSLERAPPS